MLQEEEQPLRVILSVKTKVLEVQRAFAITITLVPFVGPLITPAPVIDHE